MKIMTTELDLGFNRVPYDWAHREEWLEIPFPMDEYERRMAKVREMMAVQGLDCLLVYGGTGFLNGDVRYLSNFHTQLGNSIVCVTPDKEMLTSDSVFHSAPMHSFVHTTWVQDFRPSHLAGTGVGHGETDNFSVPNHVVDFLAENSLLDKRIGLVGEKFMSADVYNTIRRSLTSGELLNVTMHFWMIKSIKSPLEIALMEELSLATSDGLEAAMEAAVPGATELEVAAAANFAMTSKMEAVGHNMVVAGPRGGLKHLMPSTRVIEDGDMVYVDMGVHHKGYYTDAARVRCAGNVGKKQKEVLQCSYDMHNAVVEAAKPGVRIVDLQLIAQGIADKAGYGEYYWPTGFGHGIGSNVAELPSLHLGNDAELQVGNIFALEPMIVLEGFGTGVIENQILIEETGARRLTTAKEVWW